jgi:type IV pilus assembly protein PilW
MNTLPALPSDPMIHSQRGLSLIELMISLTIGMILLIGITTLIVRQSSTRDELEKNSRQIENGRYAVQLLHDDIEHAGFYGPYSPPVASLTYTSPDPCAGWNQGWSTSPLTVPTPVYGYPGGASAPVSCLTNYKSGTGVLVVRRTNTIPVPVTSAVAGITYLQVSRCPNATEIGTPFILGTGGFTLHQMDCSTSTALNQYLVHIYYISSCDVCAPSDNIPTLKMIENNGTVIPLVEGIENMQFDYGLDTDVTQGDGYPDLYTADPNVAAASGSVPNFNNTVANVWSDVMAIRVNLLARNIDCTTGYTDTKTYNLGLAASSVPAPASTCTNGDYKRHVFSELVRLVNPSGRRAQQ